MSSLALNQAGKTFPALLLVPCTSFDFDFGTFSKRPVCFQIQHMYRCARVQGLDTSEGLLLFGKEHFYVIDGYTMTVSREIRDIDTLPPK